VRVRFQNGEGQVFLPRAKPAVTIDAGTLGEADRQALEQLVTDARFFELPSRVPGPRGAENATSHITIEYRGREHSISVSHPVQGPALRRLIDRLRQLEVGR
jgi:hypothetical protein